MGPQGAGKEHLCRAIHEWSARKAQPFVVVSCTAVNPALLGRDATEKAQVADAVWRAEQDGFLAVGEALRNTAKGMKDRALTGPHNHAQIPELGERGKRRVGHFFELLDVTMAEQPFMAGENFSAADIMAFVAVEFAGWLKLTIPEDAAHAQRWFNTVKARPSASV